MIITIDGPAGSGKSSVAKKIAEILKFNFFDTGAMYRAVTWYLLDKKTDLDNLSQVTKELETFVFDIKISDSNERYYLVNGKDVSEAIRLHEVTAAVSRVSAMEEVRKKVVLLQRKFGSRGDAVFEGRDMGTVVFPYAEIKFFLTANPKIRAERRYLELSEKFPELSATYDYDKILSDIIKRDEIDSTRKISPLKKAQDAIEIDTSYLLFDKVVKKMVKIIKKKIKRRLIPRPMFLKMKPFYGLVLFLVWLYFKIFYRLKVYGIKNFIHGPAIIASNHVSFLDPPAVAVSSLEEIHFLAKEYLFKGFLGKIIRKLNSHPLSGKASDFSSLKKIITLLEEGDKVILFPEGGRSYDGKIGKILPGIGLLLYRTKCAIIPTYIHGAFDIWKKAEKRPKLFGKIRVVFGTPIYFSSIENRDKNEFMEIINLKLQHSLLSLQKWCESGFEGTPP